MGLLEELEVLQARMVKAQVHNCNYTAIYTYVHIKITQVYVNQ